jgi:hypothetical protein
LRSEESASLSVLAVTAAALYAHSCCNGKFLRACVVQFYHYMRVSAFFSWFSFGPKRELGKEFSQ